MSDGACGVPSGAGKYADANGAEKDCVADGGYELPLATQFIAPAGGRLPIQACDFTCTNSGSVKVNRGSARGCQGFTITNLKQAGVVSSGALDSWLGFSVYRGTNTRTLNLKITGVHASHSYYVTHRQDFTPRTTSDAEGSLSWWSGADTAPASYELPDADGGYKLYLWEANAQGDVVVERPLDSGLFSLNRVAPTVINVDSDVSTSARGINVFVRGATHRSLALGLTYSYCFGRDCTVSAQKRTVLFSPQQILNSLEVTLYMEAADISTLSLGENHISLKVEDWLGNSVEHK